MVLFTNCYITFLDIKLNKSKRPQSHVVDTSYMVIPRGTMF